MFYFPGEKWYALRVKYRHEQLVEDALQAKRFNPLYLTYQEKSKRKDRQKILTKAFFPGYMFFKAAMNSEMHVEVLKCRGVVQILRNSEGPIPIPSEQIDNARRLEKFTGQVLTFTEYCRGMLVKIIQGPLTGLIGRIDEVHKKIVKISIDTIPGSVGIQVPYASLEPLESGHRLSDLLRMNE